MEPLHTNKKGNFAFLGQQGIALMGFIIVLGTVAMVASIFNVTGGQIAFGWGNETGCVGAVAGETCVVANESFTGVMGNGIAGIELFGEFTELIALVLIAAVILGLLMYFRGNRR